MRILILSTSDSKGGAAQVARSLVFGLRARGHEVTFAVTDKSEPGDHSTQLQYSDKSPSQLSTKVIHRLGVNQLQFQHPFPHHTSSISLKSYDVVHLHDFAFNFRHLPWICRQAPTFWTIHSMAPFTGNCIYSYGCDRWKNNCGGCPQFGQWPLTWLHRDGSTFNLRYKRWIYSRTSLQLIGVSQWITDQIRQSVMSPLPTSTIQNAVDTDIFRPIPKAQAKAEMGISPEAFTIAFATSSNVHDTRKGIDIVQSAAARLKERGISATLLPMAIGPDSTQLKAALETARLQVVSPRHIAEKEELRLYYSAADVVWHPTRADTSSMVALEAMACGTPVIAATVGGVPEVIGDAGVLISLESPNVLATETLKLMNSPETASALSKRSRQRVVERFSIPRFLDEHEALYRSLQAQTGRSIAS